MSHPDRRSSFVTSESETPRLAGCSIRGLSTTRRRPSVRPPPHPRTRRRGARGVPRCTRCSTRAPRTRGRTRRWRAPGTPSIRGALLLSPSAIGRDVFSTRRPGTRSDVARASGLPAAGTAEACYTSGMDSLDRAPRALRRARTRPRRSRRPALPCACSSPREAPGGTSSPRSPWRTRWWRRPTGTRSPTTGRCTCLSRGPRAGRRRAWCPRRGTSCTSSPRCRSRALSPPPRTS